MNVTTETVSHLAKNNVTVKGSYKYDVENENPYEFSYSQSTGTSGGDESGDNTETN